MNKFAAEHFFLNVSEINLKGVHSNGSVSEDIWIQLLRLQVSPLTFYQFPLERSYGGERDVYVQKNK